ncbi:MAG: glycosyltransferase [Methylibium sp.]|nr:glycosyltransferase [Methylibium sp.]
MKRILFFADASSIHTQRWVRELAVRGFDCVVATRRPADVPGASEVIAVSPGADAAGWLLALPEVQRVARRVAPQWLHGHYVTSYGLWAAAASLLGPPVPLVLTAWGSDILVTPRASGWRGGAMSALVGWTLRRAALITADSQDMLAAIRGYGVKARCEEILWGADTERFRSGLPSAVFEVASLRAWEPNYNIDTLLRAWARLRNARPGTDAVLHLLGGGVEAASLQALARELKLGESVRFTGRVDDTAMVKTLQRARASVSVPSSDATSVSLLEAMACGLPVVASDLPANRQWIDAASGLLVPPRDEAALADALLRLADEPAFAEQQGRRNREVAVQRASRRTHMERMAVLYDSLRLRAPEPA